MGGILIADDQDIVRSGIRAMLTEMNLPIQPIYEAADGREALVVAEQYCTDIILTDIMMPDMDGLEFIEKLRATGSKAHVIVISAYNDFNYAQKAIRFNVDGYLLKPVDKKELYQIVMVAINNMIRENEYQGKLEEQMKQYNNMMLYGLISGKDALIQTDEVYAMTGISSMVKTYFRIALFNFECTALEALEKIKTEMDEKLIQKGYVFLSFHNGGKKIIYVLNLDETENDKVEADVKMVMDKISQDIQCGVSKGADNSKMLTELYQQAQHALRESSFSGMRFCSFANINRERVRITMAECNELLTYIEDGEHEKMNRALDKIYIKVSREKLNFENTQMIMFSLLNYLYITIGEKYKDVGTVDAVRKKLEQSENIFSIKLIVKKEIDKIYNFVDECRQRKSQSYIISQIIYYIENNYQDDISLTYLANEMNMNYSYVSNLFSKKQGITFSEYVMKIRLEKAKYLLVNTNDKVNEIALKVGFKDVKYFYKSFKKYYNITPTEMRDKHS